MIRYCRPLTEAEELEQHKIYVSGGPKGELLYCPIHRRPLIECHDEIHMGFGV